MVVYVRAMGIDFTVFLVVVQLGLVKYPKWNMLSLIVVFNLMVAV